MSSGLAMLILAFLLCQVGARRTVDLTHTFDEDAPKYPLGGFGIDSETFNYFNMTTLAEQFYGEMWIALRSYEFYEHMGTHMDAPLHFGSGRQSMSEIPPERLIGPGVVIDVKDKVSADPDYAVTVQDIIDHETKYGEIPPGAIVMMNSGWGKYYPNPNLIFGSDDIYNSSTFHFPGFSIDACKLLLNKRQVSVVGVDTASVDPAAKVDCHVYLQPNNVPLLEYVANLDSIPVRGTTIVLGAIKMRFGTGGPTRIFAIIDDDDDETNSANELKCSVVVVVMMMYFYRMWM